MAFPTITVEVDFGVDPFTALDFSSPTDITSFVQTITIRRGKQQEEQDNFQAGICEILLDNQDGRFDPNNSGSPYAPNVNSMTPIRVKAKDPGTLTVHNVFTGYVQDWPQAYPMTNSYTESKITAVDGMLLLKNRGLPQSVYEHYVEVGGEPDHYWRLNEPDLAGFDAADTGDGDPDTGKTIDGTYGSAVTRGQTGIVDNDPDTSTQFAESTNSSVELDDFRANIVGDSDFSWTLEMVMDYDGGSGTDNHIVWDQASVGGFRLVCFIDDNGSGALGFNIDRTAEGGSSSSANGSTDVGDGVRKHIAFRVDGVNSLWSVFVGGTKDADVAQTAIEPPRVTPTKLLGPIITDEADRYPEDKFGKVAIYNRVRTDSEISDQAASVLDPWDGDTSGTRVNNILDVMGWPVAADRNIDTGESTFDPADFSGFSDILTYLQRAALSENGHIYFKPDGTIRFIDRRTMNTGGRHADVQETFTDQGTATGYSQINLEPQDVDDIRNIVTVERADGRPFTIEDTDSQNTFGPRTLSRTGLFMDSDDEVRQMAEALLSQRKDPRDKLIDLTIKGDDDHWTTILTRELLDRVHVERIPDWTAFDDDRHIIGIQHDINASTEQWTTKYSLSGIETFASDVLILDDAEKGQLDNNRLGF